MKISYAPKLKLSSISWAASWLTVMYSVKRAVLQTLKRYGIKLSTGRGRSTKLLNGIKQTLAEAIVPNRKQAGMVSPYPNAPH